MDLRRPLQNLTRPSVWLGPRPGGASPQGQDSAFRDPDLRHVFLSLVSDGLGDVVNLVVLVQEIAARAPQAQIVVATNHWRLPFHFCAPNAAAVQHLPAGAAQRFPGSVYVDLNATLHYHSYCPHWLQYVLAAGLGSFARRSDPFPLLDEASLGGFPERLRSLAEGRRLVLFHMQNTRTVWEGRNTDLQNLLLLARGLREAGYQVLEVGTDNQPTGEFPHLGAVRLEEFIYAARESAGFVGVDSFPMHVAALYDRPILGFFAATNPDIVLPPVRRLIALRDEELVCNGCVYITRPVSYNRCMFGDQACRRPLPQAYLQDRLRQFLGLLAQPGATVPGPAPYQLEHLWRMSQQLHEQTLLLEELRTRSIITWGLRKKIIEQLSSG